MKLQEQLDDALANSPFLDIDCDLPKAIDPFHLAGRHPSHDIDKLWIQRRCSLGSIGLSIFTDRSAFVETVGFKLSSSLAVVGSELLVSSLRIACTGSCLLCSSVNRDTLLTQNDKTSCSLVDEHEEGLNAVVALETQVSEVCLLRADLILEE